MNAQIARAERDAELKKQEVEIARQRLDAEIRAKADADRYREEQQAQVQRDVFESVMLHQRQRMQLTL